MFLCFAWTDDVRLIASLRVSSVHDDTVKPTEQIDPLLPIGLPGIFPGDNRSVESRFASQEIKSMFPDVVVSLRVVPCWLAFIVATSKLSTLFCSCNGCQACDQQQDARELDRLWDCASQGRGCTGVPGNLVFALGFPERKSKT
jgi:hypothetical protein